MSDSTPDSDTGTGRLPPAAAFDPSDEHAVAPELRPGGTVILLLAEPDDGDWAADSAIALASAWARDGRRIVLADLHLENPSLHDRLGSANLEGMVDVFLYGASISRSARPVRGRGFYLISAGTYEPDAEAIYRHPRWPKLVAGFREAGASLVLFAPADTADLAALSRWTDRVVLLGQPFSAAALDPLLRSDVPVEALLAPPGFAVLPPPPVELSATEAAAPLRTEEERELELPPASPRPERRKGGRGWLVALLVLVAMALLAGVAYLMAGDRLALFGGAAGARAADTLAPGTAAPPSAPTRAGEALPYSVQVKAFSSFPAAQEEMLGAGGDSVPFFVSPEEVQGVLYYKIMAGLAPDTAAANGLQLRLIETGAIDADDAVGSWSLIRPTPFAFHLGEFPTREEASARADSLLAGEVPSYAVAMLYSDGSRRWQLYGGAYQDSASADAMRQRLLAAGIEPRLVLRLGDPGTGGDDPVAR